MEFSNSSPHWELGPAVPLRPWQAPDQPRCEAAPAKAARASSREVSPAGPSARSGRGWARSLLGLLGCTQAVGCTPLPALPAGEQEEEGGSETGGADFGSLPTHLLPLILGHLQCASRLTHFNVCGVSRAWRELGRQLFFSSPWSSAHLLCHPAQLFCVSPRPVETNRSGLLRCFVRRESRGCGGHRRFLLYHGRDHRQMRRTRFLMCALQASHWEMLIYLDKDCRNAPAGRLTANAFCTRYTMALAPCVRLAAEEGSGDGDAHCGGGSPCCGSGVPEGCTAGGTAEPGAPSVLGTLQYKARLQGFMQPRRVEVELPDPATLSFGPHVLPTLRRESQQPGGAVGCPSKAAPTQQAQQGEELVECGAGCSSSPRASMHGVAVAGAEGSEELPHEAAPVAAAQVLEHPPARASPGPQQGQAAQPAGLPLRNKPPQWNAQLKCWCLNFRGRVKQASVKNFQLVRGGDPAERVVLQFGKVERDTYICDFNPTVVTAYQAFCIALSTFDSKFML